MPRIARMPWLLFALAFCVAGCGKMPAPFTVKDRSPRSDKDAPFDPPNTYPEWAYDGPSYVRPAEELIPEPKVNANDPLHYFTKDRVVLIRKPEGYTPEETPRVAIWWTDNNGFHWNKAGYFGRQQGFFAFEVEEDGDYGIRFVGPGQDAAIHSLPYPERVYHVDTTLPEVEIYITPEQSWYHVGDEVTITWKAADYHLIEKPVRVGMLLDFTAGGANAQELERDLPDEGELTLTLPAETLDHEVRFRADALDRAGNLGIAISYALQVVSEGHEDAAMEDDPMPVDGQPDDGIPPGDSMTSTQGPGAPAAALPVAPPGPARAASVQGAGPIPATAQTVYPPRYGMQPQQAQPLQQPPQSAQPQPIASEVAEPARAKPPVTTEARQPSKPPVPFNASRKQKPTPTAATTAIPTPIKAPPAKAARVEPPSKPIGIADAPQASFEGDGLTPEAPYEQSDQMIEVIPESPPPADDAATDEADEDDEAEPSAMAPGLEPEDFLIAAAPPRGLDPLLVPLPATVQSEPALASAGDLHPWRSLTAASDAPLSKTVWLLPCPQFIYELDRITNGRYLAKSGREPVVSEPGATPNVFVSVPGDSLNEEPYAIP